MKAYFIVRRKSLLVINGLVVLNIFLSASTFHTKSLISIVVARFLFGIICGLFTSSATIYLLEIAPRNLRGTAVTLHQSFLIFGMLISHMLGSSQMFGTSRLWPCLYGVQLIPAFVLFCFLPFCCESPKFVYLKQNDPFEAEQSRN